MVKVTQKILQCMSSLKPSIVLTTDWLQSNQGVSFLVVPPLFLISERMQQQGRTPDTYMH